MPMTTAYLTKEINLVVNRALGSVAGGSDTRYIRTSADIATALTAAATAVTALSGVTHDRTIQDPGTALSTN